MEHHEGLKPFAMWANKAAELWTPDAQDIIVKLETNDSVFVDAPNGSGKTRFLTPKIQELAASRGWQSTLMDVTSETIYKDEPDITIIGKFTNRLNRLSIVEGNKTGVMILDEIGGLSEFDLLRVIRLAEKRGYRKFVLIPAGTSANVRESRIAAIQKVLSKVGKSSDTYKMDRKVIPEDLSREFFELHMTPKEIIDYILPNYPLYLKTLDFFRDCKSIDCVREKWHNSHYWGISLEEQYAVEDKLRENYGKR